MEPQQFLYNLEFDFNDAENILKCSCYSENCIKRSIWFDDIISGYGVNLKFCHSTIKLAFENINRFDVGSYKDLMEYIVLYYHTSKYGIRMRTNDRSSLKELKSQCIFVCFSQKPFISGYCYLVDVLQYLVDNPVRITDEFRYRIGQCFVTYFKRNNFKKNKTLKENIIKNLKKLSNWNTLILSDPRDIEVLDILNKTLELTIKNQ